MKLPVAEIFFSFQGEGIFVGEPAVFLRLAGCPMSCKFCDTPIAKASGRWVEVSDILKMIRKIGAPNLVVTGGEPLFFDNLVEFLERVVKFFKRVEVETSAYEIVKDIPKEVFLNISPKPPSMGVPFFERNFIFYLKNHKNVQLKFLALDARDFAFIRAFCFKNKELIPKPLVIQPIDTGKNYEKNVKEVMEIVSSDKEFIFEFDVRVIPQVHKLVGLK